METIKDDEIEIPQGPEIKEPDLDKNQETPIIPPGPNIEPPLEAPTREDDRISDEIS